MNKQYSERRQWFMSHIGQRIWRNKVSCNCKSCQSGYEIGVLVHDEEDAGYFHDVESSPDEIVKYFDTKEERDIFEKTIK